MPDTLANLDPESAAIARGVTAALAVRAQARRRVLVRVGLITAAVLVVVLALANEYDKGKGAQRAHAWRDETRRALPLPGDR